MATAILGAWKNYGRKKSLLKKNLSNDRLIPLRTECKLMAM
jgi:hypothetical protein